MKKKLPLIAIILIFLIGIGVLSYPLVSSVVNNIATRQEANETQKTIKIMPEAEKTELYAQARAYNNSLTDNVILTDPFDEEAYRKIGADYANAFDVNGRGLIGYVDIPKLDVYLPVYHGTGNEVLKGAIGHLEGSSLPVGGKGTHCVLSGHRGLPSARLFTDLDKMKEGDTFTLTILNEMLTYEVDQIKIIEPYDYAPLQIYEGDDFCTLMTCTPYGINTQRLLVRGRRIDNPNGEAQVIADAIQIEASYVAPFIAVPMVFVLLLWMFLAERARRQDKMLVERTRESLNLSKHSDISEK